MNTSVEIQDGITPTLSYMADNFPRDFWRGMHSASKWAVKRIRSNFEAEATANSKLAPLSELTKQLRASRMERRKNRSASLRQKKRDAKERGNWLDVAEFTARQRSNRKAITRIARLGGKLSGLFEYQINQANWMVRIGWLGERFAKSQVSGMVFQKDEARMFTRKERHWLHRSLRSRSIPSDYRKPLRSTIAPYQIDPETNAQFRDVVWKTIQNLAKWRASQGAAQVSQ